MDRLYNNASPDSGMSSGAPRQPEEQHQTETAENTEDDGAHQPVEWTFELRWMVSGNLIQDIRNWEGEVERLAQYLDEGIFEDDGAPGSKTDYDYGTWWESYRLFYRDVELQDGRNFSDYGIPNKGATIYVIKTLVYQAEVVRAHCCSRYIMRT